MNKFTTAVKAFIDDEGGVTAIEYGLMAAVLAGAVTAVGTTLKTELGTVFSDLMEYIKGLIPA